MGSCGGGSKAQTDMVVTIEKLRMANRKRRVAPERPFAELAKIPASVETVPASSLISRLWRRLFA